MYVFASILYSIENMISIIVYMTWVLCTWLGRLERMYCMYNVCIWMYLHVSACICMYMCVLLLRTTDRTLFSSVSWLHSWRAERGTWKLACGGHDFCLWQEEGNMNQIADLGKLAPSPSRWRLLHHSLKHALLQGCMLSTLHLWPSGLPWLGQHPILHQLVGHDLASWLP